MELPFHEIEGGWDMAAELMRGRPQGWLRVRVWRTTKVYTGPEYKVLWKVGTRRMMIYCDHGEPPPPFIRWQVDPELLEFLREVFDTFLDLGFPWSAWFLNECACGAGTFEPCRSKSKRGAYNRVVHRERGR